MRLTWETGYCDYDDVEHWLPILKELQCFEQTITIGHACEMEEETLLNAMERLEELMRFYASTGNYRNLEQVMRKQDKLLCLCSERGISGIGYRYLDMEFTRLNALLYRAHDRNKQSVEYFNQFCCQSQMVFHQLISSKDRLSKEQILYIGWSCVEGCKEAIQANDAILNTVVSMGIMKNMIPMLDWLKPYMEDAAGICDQSAEMYAMIAGAFYMNGDSATGMECYQNSLYLYQKIVQESDSDFYQAKYIWVMGMQGFQEFLVNGNPEVMLRCETLARIYLQERHPLHSEQGIVIGVLGMIAMQKSSAYQQEENLQEAITFAESACSYLQESMDLLECAYKEHQGYYRLVVSEMVAKIFNAYVGAAESSGIQYYYAGRFIESKEMLEKALELLTDCKEYSMSESAAMVVRAESFQYLALIAMEHGDSTQAEFYGTQGIEFANHAAAEAGNSAAYQIEIACCTLMAELYLNRKEKEKAKEYAMRGLTACETLSSIQPQNPQLEMRTLLEKYYKKASRKFF